MIGSQDILIALALGLIFFGGKKLPEFARGLGESLKEFKKATTKPDEPPDPSPAPPPPPPTITAGTHPCPSCQTAVQAEWAHCPRCGAAIGPLGAGVQAEPRATHPA
jgi:sec-independent protein translocase protein TatA